ncbi:MAG: DNA photolyase FAD-binding protein [Acidiphilium sp. 21-60-14]|nr:MAG: DNA photolyase FAD-binding protein [Acidiphilium sp. 21-60-14]OZB37971.1 MAG: DNA photolyase FAD-binding protein [Acidiphilium sp. 34-60-192]
MLHPLTAFPPTRAAALDRLGRFAPKAGGAYDAGRNTDPGPDQPGAVSKLSPYLRRRLITEAEVTARVLDHHSAQAAEKFLQEVLWRTYWKGWLEMRPGVWNRFLQERAAQRDRWAGSMDMQDAEQGRTGIEGFDDWARELVATGYLHNHARMWFASIWIFTLRLPWVLGADFFLRHLLDADPASNTLSWRWVAGLQTRGKTYLATTENIARYTKGRFAPAGLAPMAEPLMEPPLEAPRPLPDAESRMPDEPTLLLITDEDLYPESMFPARANLSAALIASDPHLHEGALSGAFAGQAAEDTAARVADYFGIEVQRTARLDADSVMRAADAAHVRQIITPYAPVGPVASALSALTAPLAAAGMSLRTHRRSWDAQFWPCADKGFFSFKERIPAGLRTCGLI